MQGRYGKARGKLVLKGVCVFIPFRLFLAVRPPGCWYGNILLGPLGRHEEAIAELKRAQSLDPSSLIINTDLGYAYYLARRYDTAFSQYQKVLVMDRTFVPVHSDLARYYAENRMYNDWLREEITDSILAGNPKQAQTIKHIYAHGGFKSFVSKMAASRGQLEPATTEPNRQSFCTAAEAYATLKEIRPAMAALEKCYAGREPGLLYLKVEPTWDSLRSDAAFQALEHRMGLQ